RVPALFYDLVEVRAGPALKVAPQLEVFVPLVLRVVAVAAADVLHPGGHVHRAVGTGQGVAELDEAVVVVVGDGGKGGVQLGHRLGRDIVVADVGAQPLHLERMGQTDAGHFVVAQLVHILPAIIDVAEVAVAVPPADVVQQAQHIRLVRVEAGAPGRDLFGAAGRGAAVVVPAAMGLAHLVVAGFGAGQDALSFLAGGIHSVSFFQFVFIHSGQFVYRQSALAGGKIKLGRFVPGPQGAGIYGSLSGAAGWTGSYSTPASARAAWMRRKAASSAQRMVCRWTPPVMRDSRLAGEPSAWRTKASASYRLATFRLARISP